jgi:tetratricopeptide (TPR) repeat protein
MMTPAFDGKFVRDRMKRLPPAQLLDLLLTVRSDDNTLYLQSGRLQDIEQKWRAGTLNDPDFRTEKTRIGLALLELVDQLEPADLQTASHHLEQEGLGRMKRHTVYAPPSSQKILERRDLLERIRQAFQHVPIVILTGESGRGKTKVAENYFARSATDYAHGAWYHFSNSWEQDFYLKTGTISDWVGELLNRYDRAGRIEEGYRECALACRKFWSEELDGRKLIVLDGVQHFIQLLPRLPLLEIRDAHILITSQTAPPDDFHLLDVFDLQVIEVPPLSEEELQQMFRYYDQPSATGTNDDRLKASLLALHLYLSNAPRTQPESTRILIDRMLRIPAGREPTPHFIRTLYDFADLPPAFRWVLLQLAALPDRPLDLDFLALLLGLPDESKPVYSQSYNIFKGKYRSVPDEIVRLDEVCDHLVKLGWLEDREYGALYLHRQLLPILQAVEKPKFDYFLGLAKRLELSFFLNENGYEGEEATENQQVEKGLTLSDEDQRLHRLSNNDLHQYFSAFCAFVQDDDSLELVNVLWRFADLLENTVRWWEELPYRWRINSILERAVLDNDDIRWKGLEALGDCFFRVGDYRQALDCWSEELYLKLRVFSETDLALAGCWHDLGRAYRHLRKYELALQAYFKSLQIKQLHLSPINKSLAITYTSIAIAYEKLRDYPEALDYTQKALDILLEVLPFNNTHVANSYNTLGVIYSDLENYSQAIENLQKALDIRLEVLPSNHPHVAESYLSLGAIYHELEDYPQSLENVQKALAIRENILPPDHLDLAEIYKNISQTYEKLDQPEQAAHYRHKVEAIRGSGEEEE